MKISTTAAYYCFASTIVGVATAVEFPDIANPQWFQAAKPQPFRRNLQVMDEDSPFLLADHFGGEPGFYHGVASGDPLSDAVIVWTRYTPLSSDERVDVELRMAKVDGDIPVEAHLDPSANPNLKRTLVTATSETDWVVKLDITGLESYQDYVFAFVANGKHSDVGQTRTAPTGSVEQLVYATFSCAHFANGYFHAYDVASTIEDLDFWVHVGDYVYEYGLYSTYASDAPERKAMILPEWEQISLQDHRNRHLTYLLDEGLRNLRRRAPLLATWDDHETTNNAYGDGTIENTGAENHQEFCPVNSTSPDSEKADAQCDRDEWRADIRFTAATQAYLEYLPLRHAPGPMGVVEIASITQEIQWGDLATFVLFDTRITNRSKNPTLASGFAPFGALAGQYTNYTAYSDPASEEYAAFAEVAETVLVEYNNPEYTMIGPTNMETLRAAFCDTETTWKVWGAATMMGPQLAPDLVGAEQYLPEASEALGAYIDAAMQSENSGFFRSLHAMNVHNVPWNPDGFDGFSVERAAILDMVKGCTSNGVILGGDLHDSWAWTLYEGGAMEGEAVAVNLGAPGVTSPGWGGFIPGFFAGSDGAVTPSTARMLAEKASVDINPGLQYAEISNKGFFAAKITKESHTTEYFHVTPETILSDFETARAASGGITADFFCGSSLVTMEGVPGSLETMDSCGAISFANERPAVWSLPVPEAPISDAAVAEDCGYLGCTINLGATDEPSTKCRRRL